MRKQSFDEYKVIDFYKKQMMGILSTLYPSLSIGFISNALDNSIQKRYNEHKVSIKNNYVNTQVDNMPLIDLTDYIIKNKPIMTAYGVLFKRHEDSENPLIEMIEMFMNNRNIHKKEMFKYPKGSEEYEKYNLLQLLDKIDCNAIYGILSAPSSALYNINVAASITAQGRSLISSATMFFEMFLANNVKFASLDEVLLFISNVKNEKPYRIYNDNDILDRDITPEECFSKVVLSIGDFRKGRVKWCP